MKVLVTGAAGFIGFHLTRHLLERGDTVIGLDNLNDYYPVSLKKARLAQLTEREEFAERFVFVKMGLEDRPEIEALFAKHTFDAVVNLAAQAGVRYSLENPHAYVDANVVGFMNVLECCRQHNIGHLVYASSSSVYGMNTSMPFSTRDNVDHPISLYAATKKTNELMAHTYSHLYQLPTTGLRFFTVYGPWGRPDMALFLFTKAIVDGEPINIFNHGDMLRDFTYIDDIVEGIVRTLDKPATGSQEWNAAAPTPEASSAPYRLFNIGNNNPVRLMEFIEAIERALGKTAEKNFLPMQPGDVPATYADVDDLAQYVDYRPATPVNEGVQKFVQWYLNYTNKNQES